MLSFSLRFNRATCVLGTGIFGGGRISSEDDDEDEDESSPVGEYRGYCGLPGFGLRDTDLDLDRLSLF